MGNQHTIGSSLPESASSSTTNLSAVIRKTAMAKSARLRLAELRRLSVDAIAKKREQEAHANHRSFTFGQSPANSLDSDGPGRGGSSDEFSGGKQKVTPRIEINGTPPAMALEDKQKPENPDTGNLGAKMADKNGVDQRRGSSGSSIGFGKHRAHKVDSRKIAAKKRLERGQTTTAKPEKEADGRRDGFFRASTAGGGWARSLDTHNGSDFAALRSAACTRSPLMHHRQQQRRTFGSNGGSGGLFGGGGLLGREQSEAVARSWRRARERIEQFAGGDRCFAYYAFDRIFERAPELKPLFGISPSHSLADLDDQPLHPFTRHVRVFNNILDLSARNAAELETEMLPALFTYGQRHYKPKLMDEFGERTVRLFCSQVVGTMCDLLGDEFSALELDAWIDMVTHMGRALLSGFEYERQNGRKRSNKF